MNSWIYLDEKIGLSILLMNFHLVFTLEGIFVLVNFFVHQYVEQSLSTSMFMTTIVDYECQKEHDILFGHWFLDFLYGSHDTSLNWYTWGHKNIWCNYVRKAIRAIFQPLWMDWIV